MRLPDPVLVKLSDFQAWSKSGSNGMGFDLLDYVGCVATPDLFFGFLELLCPSLVIHDGAYFLESDFDPKNYAAWKEKLSDVVAVQKIMNHIHITMLFQGQSVDDEIARLTAECIAEVWRRQFADLGLTAEAFGSELHDAQVTLFKGSSK
jgi:hypothetical protein